MTKPKDNRKSVFTAIGIVEAVGSGDNKKLRLVSPAHWQHWVNKLIPGKKYAIAVEEYKSTRSEAQLHYHWVLMTYLADFSGGDVTKEEMHDAVMRAKFGTREIRIGSLVQTVRRSISDGARMPKYDAVELITFDLALCEELGIRVPTKEELGYLPS